jgi:hypothetical protein
MAFEVGGEADAGADGKVDVGGTGGIDGERDIG